MRQLHRALDNSAVTDELALAESTASARSIVQQQYRTLIAHTFVVWSYSLTQFALALNAYLKFGTATRESDFVAAMLTADW